MNIRKNNYSTIAKERLKLMMESDSLEYSSKDIAQLKKEISQLVSRYFDSPADMYEIKITLKQNKKRV
jgi:septum formation topological specificity factor MinE